MTLIEKVKHYMDTDDTDQSGLLKNYYVTASTLEQARIDLCFIALCGYRLKTLIGEDQNEPLS